VASAKNESKKVRGRAILWRPLGA